MTILHVDSSILGDNSVSRALTAQIVAAEQQRHPEARLVYRDLATQPIGHLSGAHLAAAQGASPESPELQKDIEAGVAALDEFLAADIVVVGAPMYNFGVPSQIKAWIDRLAVAGRTFRYSENGPEGLAGGKRVIIASSRGGFYGPDSPANFLDHQESYLKGLFGFFGITDVTIVRAEGLNVSTEQRELSLESAKAEIARIAA